MVFMNATEWILVDIQELIWSFPLNNEEYGDNYIYCKSCQAELHRWNIRIVLFHKMAAKTYFGTTNNQSLLQMMLNYEN